VQVLELISHYRVDFYQEGVPMKIDKSKSDATQVMCEGDRQNRREFFNGLGKWSMIVVAAVSYLRESATGSQARHEVTPEPQRPAWTVPDDGKPRQRMAGHFKQRHINEHYNTSYQKHTEYYKRAIIQ
jgi:hypothetical protein